MSATREHSCQRICRGDAGAKATQPPVGSGRGGPAELVGHDRGAAMPPADSGRRTFDQSAPDNERCQARQPHTLVSPDTEGAARPGVIDDAAAETAGISTACAEPSRLAGSPAHRTCSSRREEGRPVGRKSRTKAERRAARAAMPGREVGRSASAGWFSRPSLEVDRPPDLPSSWTQGSPPRRPARAPTSPLRASPPATARPATYEQLAVLVARRAAAQEALEPRSAHSSVKGAAGPTSAGSLACPARVHGRGITVFVSVTVPEVRWQEAQGSARALGMRLWPRSAPSGKLLAPRSTRWARASRRVERGGQGCRAESGTVGKGLSSRVPPGASVSPSRAGAGHSDRDRWQANTQQPWRPCDSGNQSLVAESSRAPSRLAGPPAHR